MREIKKPTIWRYLIWGLIVGWIGSLIVVKVFTLDVIAKTHIFQQIFGPSFSYESISWHGNTYHKEYYEYIVELLTLPVIGIIMGLAASISNRSFRKAVFSVLGGLLTGFAIPYFYTDLVIEPFFFSNMPNLLFWYATVITSVISIINIVERRVFVNILITCILSLLLSYCAIMLISLVGSLAGAMIIGLGFAGSESPETPYIFVGIFAVTLLNITINFGEWAKIDIGEK